MDPELCFTTPLAGEGSSSSTTTQAGSLPLGDALRDLLLCDDKMQGRGPEASYNHDSHEQWTSPLEHDTAFNPSCLLAGSTHKDLSLPVLSSAAVAVMHDKQQAYFKKLDKFEIEVPTSAGGADDQSDPFKVHLREVQAKAQDHLEMELVRTSNCKIVNTAYYVLQRGLFTDPANPKNWNAHQCLGFLLHATLLQKRVNEKSAASSSSTPSQLAPKKTEVHADYDFDQCCIFTGAA